MKYLLSGVIALVTVCRLAQGGEGIALGDVGNPMGVVFRLITDFGALGAFVIFLILDRKADRKRRDEERETEQKRRDEDRERWHALDQALMGLVRECTAAISESTNVLAELRKDVWRLIKGRLGRNPSDSDRMEGK